MKYKAPHKANQEESFYNLSKQLIICLQIYYIYRGDCACRKEIGGLSYFFNVVTDKNLTTTPNINYENPVERVNHV